MQSKWPMEITLILMVLMTVLAVTFKENVLRTTLVITPESHPQTFLYTDTLSGGNSTSEKTSLDSFQWKCNLQDRFPYPYCGLEVYLGPDRTNGKNLERFEKIKLWINYSGNSETLRIYLRNFDPVYSKKDIAKSTKYNQIEFPVSNLKNQPIEFSLRDFSVANWWIVERKIDTEINHPQFDNIVFIEVHTGSQSPLGEHHFKLEKIELSGQWITAENWYLLIVCTWMGGLIIFIVYRMIYLGQQLLIQKKRREELHEINALLDVRSKEVDEKNKTNSLTFTFNRKAIEDAVLMGLSDWRIHNKPLSLILMNVDHFKGVNDKYGYDIGDQVLSGLAQLVKDHIRASDLFLRWGGEEFVLFCRNTNIKQSLSIAEKIRELIEQHFFSNSIHITVSMGVSSLQSNQTPEQLFDNAAKALFHAKNEGRNRVIAG